MYAQETETMNGLGLRLTGQPGGLRVLDIRDATEEDFGTPMAEVDFSIKRIRATHHEVARLLAVGHKNVEVAAMTGYTPQTVSNLQNNPMFQELLAVYQSRRDDQVFSIARKLDSVAGLALEELADRLENTPEEFTPSQLREIARDMADRVGYSPIKKTASVSLTSQDIEDLKKPISIEDSRPETPIELDSAKID